MDTIGPRRPMLAAHVLARRHVVDGSAGVILMQRSGEDAVRVGAREWAVLSVADGTRDVGGVVIAAARHGVRVAIDEAARMLAELAMRGFVVDGAAPIDDAPGERVEPTPPDRPLVALPGYALRCDRSGTCCRAYATIIATDAEAERARVLLPERRIGSLAGERLFMPLYGVARCGAWAIAERDGACAYLDDDGACALHRAGGSQAKPAGCRIFPSTFVDDGVCVRVSVKPECACVLDGAAAGEGSPLVHGRTVADLPPEVIVARLPATVAVGRGPAVSPAAAPGGLAAALASADASDLAARCWGLADGLDRAGLSHRQHGARATATAVTPWMSALARHAAARSRIDARWRSVRDRQRIVATAIATAAVVLSDAGMLAEALAVGPEHPEHEALYVRASVFDRRWLAAGRPLSATLRDVGVRLWLARALPTFADIRAPLAAVEAWLRGHGVARYADAVGAADTVDHGA